jgi:hypothetical protein
LVLWNVFKCISLLQYNFTVPLWNLNCTESKLIHGPPTTPAASSPRVEPSCLIFPIYVFSLSIFSCTQLRVASCHFLFRFMIIVSPILQMVLSLVGRPCCCSATSSAALNKMTGRGGPASYMGYPLPCAPGSVRRMPCGQGSPLHRPDGAGQFQRKDKVVDTEDEDDEDEDGELDSSSSDRWVPRSGPPGCVACPPGALWASGAFGSLRRALRRGSLGCCCCFQARP